MSRAEHLRTAAGALVAGIALALAAGRWGRFTFPIDDAYIYLQYAASAGDGHPFRYAPGEPLTSGATSPGWWFLVQTAWFAARAVRISPVAAVLAVHALVTAATLFLACRVTRRLGAPPIGAAAVPVLLLTTPLWCFGWNNGMETGLYGLALLGGVWAGLGGSPTWLALLPLARPEGAVVALALAVWIAIRGGGPRPRTFVPALVASAVALGWPWLLTGHGAAGWAAKSVLAEPDPAQRAATLHALPGSCVRALWFGLTTARQQASPAPLAGGWNAWGAAVFLGGGVLALLARRRGLPVVVWALASLLALTAITWESQEYRYLIAAYPALVAAALAGWFGPAPERRRLIAGTLLLTALAARAVLGTSPVWATTASVYRNSARLLEDEQLRVAGFVRSALPPTARVATHDVGAVAYAGGHPVVDFVGLVTPETMGAYRYGGGAVWEAVSSLPPDRRPTHAVIIPAWRPYLYQTLWFDERLDANTGKRRSPKSRTFEVWSLSWPDEDSRTWPGGDFSDAPAGAIYAGREILEQLDVADLRSERDHRFHSGDSPGGELTVVRDLGFAEELRAPTRSHAVDGGRTLTGTTRFQLRPRGPAALLVLRTASSTATTLNVSFKTRVTRTTGSIAVPADESRFAELQVPFPGVPDGGVVNCTLLGGPVRVYNIWLLSRE